MAEIRVNKSGFVNGSDFLPHTNVRRVKKEGNNIIVVNTDETIVINAVYSDFKQSTGAQLGGSVNSTFDAIINFFDKAPVDKGLNEVLIVNNTITEEAHPIIIDHENNTYTSGGNGAASMIKVLNPTLFSSWQSTNTPFNLYLDLPEWNLFIIEGSFSVGNGGSNNTSIVGFKIYVFPISPTAGGTRIYLDDASFSTCITPLKIARKGSINRLFFGDLIARYAFNFSIDSVKCRRSSLDAITNNGLKLIMNTDAIPVNGVDGWTVYEYPSGSVNTLVNSAWITSNLPTKAVLGANTGQIHYNGTTFTARSLNSTDVAITNNATERVPMLKSGAFESQGVILSVSNTANSIPKRDASGVFEVGTANNTHSINSAVNLELLQGVINNTLSAQETSATLNSLYPTAPIGITVKSLTNAIEYTKIGVTQWNKKTLDIV